MELLFRHHHTNNNNNNVSTKYRHELFHLDKSIGLFSIDEIAKNLKDNGFWVNAVDERGNTPLHIAAKNNEISFVRAMLPHFGRVNTFNNHGDTVLHIFIENCMKNQFNFSDKSSSSIRTFISKSTYFNKRHRIIRSLLSKGADVNLKNKQGITPAQLAAKYGYIDILKIFESNKRQLNVDGDENLLHLVCKNAKSAYRDTPMEMKVMCYLIKQGCDANSIDNDGYSALHYALETRSVDTVKKLLQQGFDLPRWNKKVLSNLSLKASATSNPSVIRFLIEQGANVNVRNASGMTPLHFAASRLLQQSESMEILLKSGAHIDATDDAGFLPLDYALKNKNVDGLECLMEFGVDVLYTSSFRKLTFDQVMDHWFLDKFVLKHMTQLKAVGFKIDPIYEPYLKRNEWQVYKHMCREEVKELKLCMVDERMSLYEFLHMKTKYCRYTHLPKLLRNLKSTFPIYYGIIRIRIHEIEKKTLIKPATQAWYELTNIPLPYICVENILSNLDTCCLRMMIDRSSENKIVYNPVELQAEWLEE